MADLPRYNLSSDEGPPQQRMFGHDRVPPLPNTSDEKQISFSEDRVDSGVGYSLESQDALSFEGVREIRDFMSSERVQRFRKLNEKCASTSDSYTSGLQNELKQLSLRDGEHAKESVSSNRCDSGICDSGNFSVEEPPFIQAAFPECNLSSNVSYGNSFFSLQEMEELTSPDEDGDTPLHMSIILMAPDVSLKILAATHTSPHSVSQPNVLHQTPLHLAVATRQFGIVRSLMVAGAVMEIPDFCGNTALHLACRDGLVELALCLLTPVSCPEWLAYPVPLQAVPQDLAIKNYDGYTCAHLALMEGHHNILALLLQKGADVNEPDGKSGRTLLHMAADLGDLKALQLLLSHPGLNLNAQTYSGLTAVSLAHGRRFNAFVEQLYRRGADCSQILEEATASNESTDEEMSDCVYDDICINGEPVQFS
ncbi:hypothetical protein ACOMHN_025782 [Nucella lapillus]